MTDQEQAFEAWKAERLAALAAPGGWLNIVSRDPLEPRPVTVGSGAGNDIVLPAGPAHVGRLSPKGENAVLFEPADGGPAQTLELSKTSPPRFTAGPLLLEITTLNGENALRVRDTSLDLSGRLPVIETFPYDPFWRIEARWVALPAPQRMTIDTVTRISTEVEATHKAAFEHGGRQFELIATHGTPARPQFVFRDRTSGNETYAAARFLFGEDVTEDGILLDFNKAINPPCAFTDFAICPLPPSENILPIRVEAGEKRLR